MRWRSGRGRSLNASPGLFETIRNSFIRPSRLLNYFTGSNRPATRRRNHRRMNGFNSPSQLIQNTLFVQPAQHIHPYNSIGNRPQKITPPQATSSYAVAVPNSPPHLLYNHFPPYEYNTGSPVTSTSSNYFNETLLLMAESNSTASPTDILGSLIYFPGEQNRRSLNIPVTVAENSVILNQNTINVTIS